MGKRVEFRFDRFRMQYLLVMCGDGRVLVRQSLQGRNMMEFIRRSYTFADTHGYIIHQQFVVQLFPDVLDGWMRHPFTTRRYGKDVPGVVYEDPLTGKWIHYIQNTDRKWIIWGDDGKVVEKNLSTSQAVDRVPSVIRVNGVRRYLTPTTLHK